MKRIAGLFTLCLFSIALGLAPLAHATPFTGQDFQGNQNESGDDGNRGVLTSGSTVTSILPTSTTDNQGNSAPRGAENSFTSSTVPTSLASPLTPVQDPPSVPETPALVLSLFGLALVVLALYYQRHRRVHWIRRSEPESSVG